jgi:hypothetical protein
MAGQDYQQLRTLVDKAGTGYALDSGNPNSL